MDLVNLFTSLGGVGALGGLFAWLGNRALNRTIEKINEANARKTLADAEISHAEADSTSADYAEKIIKQSDERVAQALADRDRAVTERDAAYVEAKGQRKAKQEWRGKFLAEEKEHHATQLTLKDTEGLLKEAKWNECKVNGCVKRVPPRNRETDQ